MTRFVVRRFKTFGPKTLTSVIGVLTGGAAIKFIDAGKDKDVWWFYPIGLFLGFLVYTLVAFWFYHEEERKGPSINLDWLKNTPSLIKPLWMK